MQHKKKRISSLYSSKVFEHIAKLTCKDVKTREKNKMQKHTSLADRAEAKSCLLANTNNGTFDNLSSLSNSFNSKPASSIRRLSVQYTIFRISYRQVSESS